MTQGTPERTVVVTDFTAAVTGRWRPEPEPPSGIARQGYARPVARKVWTATELERLTPAEQDALFDASVVTSLSDVPDAFLDRVRARLDERIARSETPKAT